MSSAPLKILVGSENPVKINATQHTFSMCFPHREVSCQGIHAPSGVAEQPMTESETRAGAINRVRYCQAQQDADYCVAIEGGVDNFSYGPATFAYVVIAHQEQIITGRGANLPLPTQVYDALSQGKELGTVIDELFNTENIKQKGGAIGMLTGNLATRESNYRQALVLAMAPILNPHLY